MPSTLIRIFGAFKLNQKSQKPKKKFFILQENLAGLPPSLFKSYKLRPEKKGKNSESLQNSDFFNDFCGLPILLNSECKKVQDAGIWNDSLFLSKNNVMNYSLVVKVNQEDLSVAAGIGDYFDELTVEKAIENKYKLLLGNDSNNPDVYKELFREEMMKTYFTSQ
jgi:1-phosphatidylinositol-3-phosphate 5-kinase